MKRFLPLLIVSAFAVGMLLTFATISFSPEKNKLPSPPMKRISVVHDKEISTYLVNKQETNPVAENEKTPISQPAVQLIAAQEELIPATTR